MARLGNKLSRAGSSKHTTPTKSKPKHWHLQTGTPNTLTEPIRFDSHTKLKNTTLKIIADWEPWCLRHNKAGSEALCPRRRTSSTSTTPSCPTAAGVFEHDVLFTTSTPGRRSASSCGERHRAGP